MGDHLASLAGLYLHGKPGGNATPDLYFRREPEIHDSCVIRITLTVQDPNLTVQDPNI